MWQLGGVPGEKPFCKSAEIGVQNGAALLPTGKDFRNGAMLSTMLPYNTLVYGASHAKYCAPIELARNICLYHTKYYQ